MPSLQGRLQRDFGRGSQNPAGDLGGAVSPQRGDFEINAFQRLITPVYLTFESHCCYTKSHAIFFTHSHRHHFQLNEVVHVDHVHALTQTIPNMVDDLPSFECFSLPKLWGLLVFLTLEIVLHCSQSLVKRGCCISTGNLRQSAGGEQSHCDFSQYPFTYFTCGEGIAKVGHLELIFISCL